MVHPAVLLSIVVLLPRLPGERESESQ